jgi:hypothetical protein
VVVVVSVEVVLMVVSVVVPGSSAKATGAPRNDSASVNKSPRASIELLMQYPLVAYRTGRLLG